MGRHVRLALALLAAAAVAVLTPTVAGAAGGGDRAGLSRELAEVRRATQRYHDVAAAVEDGYLPTDVCVSSPAGTMGFHYFNPRVTTLDPRRPTLLLYVPHGRGLRLAGVEYFKVDRDQRLDTDDDRPWMFGRPFDGPMPGHEPGMPVHYDLHVWVWAHNPDGVFAPWNRRLSC